MPLLRINAEMDRPVLHGGGDLHAALSEQLMVLPDGAPVVVMIHGYRFSPTNSDTCPHRHILSIRPRKGCWKAISWPRHLGFGRGKRDEGLAIAFGWEARGSIWQAWASAAAAGAALAELIGRVQALRKVPVDLLTHSLGARVALAALPQAPAGSVGRIVLLAAAEFQSTAVAALAMPAGRGAEFINVTSRENDLFDKLLEGFVRAPKRSDCALGAGLGQDARNWLDLQMDCPAVRSVLAELGYRVPPPVRRVCHWSAYLRPGLFVLYLDLIRRRPALPLELLRARLPERAANRWSRLFKSPMLQLPIWPRFRSRA
ncbi:MAG: hypothetical protein QNJ16_16055 [Rhodobacter sp.]|nr:hypothetical protein [Rhodobacter sp.]